MPTLLHCDHATECAGCTALDEAYETQLAQKKDRVARAFSRYAALAHVRIAEVEGASITDSYRTRAKLVVAAEQGSPSIGLFARDGSHRVVDIPQCRVLTPPVARAVASLRALFRQPPDGLDLWLRPRELGGALRAVDVREVVPPDSSAGVIVTLVFDRFAAGPRVPPPTLQTAVSVAVPALVTLAISWHSGHGPQVLGGVPTVVAGDASVRDRATSAVVVRAVPGGFVQAHRAQAERVYDRVATLLTEALATLEGRRVLDAYAGAGAIGLNLSARGARVDLVESIVPAAEAAQRAADEQQLQARAVSGDAEKVIEQWVSSGETADAVVLNPPRRGVTPSVRASVARLGPEAVAYVSCEPESLARDLDHFERLGYRCDCVEPFDLMPQTHEVESVVVLRRRNPIPPMVLARSDAGAIFLNKSPHEPVTRQAAHVSGLLDRARAALAEPRLSAIQSLDEGTSGVCLFARDSDAAAEWARRFASDESEQSYVALVRGIARDKGIVRRPLKAGKRAREATTRYRRLDVVAGHSLVRVTVGGAASPQQIRRHLAGIGHAVLGDERFGHAASNRHMAERYGLDRAFLHCERVRVPNAGADGVMDVCASLPGDLASVLARMGAAPIET